MSFYDSIEKYLTNIISEFKVEAKRVHLVAEQGIYMDGRDMENLAKANARGIAAQTVQNLMNLHLTRAKEAGKNEEEARTEALPFLIRAVQDRLDGTLSSRQTPHVATIIVYNDVLNALRNEAAGF